MTSELRVTTLSNATGDGPATLLKQSAAKAWVNFNGTGTPAINNSNNVSTLTDTGQGQQTFTFTNNMNNTNYAPTAISTAAVYASSNIGSAGIGSAPYSKTTSQVRLHIGEQTDPADAAAIIHGDLA